MKERFEGQGSENLLAALQRQEFIGNSRAIAERFAAAGMLLEVTKGDASIRDAGQTMISSFCSAAPSRLS
jgi:hypothetical protein